MNPQEIQRTGKLLNKVHIQTDNTCRENKNQFMSGFLTYLVELGLAKEIRHGFLAVGYVIRKFLLLFPSYQ